MYIKPSLVTLSSRRRTLRNIQVLLISKVFPAYVVNGLQFGGLAVENLDLPAVPGYYCPVAYVFATSVFLVPEAPGFVETDLNVVFAVDDLHTTHRRMMGLWAFATGVPGGHQ